MTAYSNPRLFAASLVSTLIAAVVPSLSYLFAGRSDAYDLIVSTVFSLSTLVIGACVSFLVTWPAALLLEARRIPIAPGVITIGTLAWTLIVSALVLVVNSGNASEVPLLALLAAGLGAVTSTAFVVVAGVRSPARRTT